MVMEAGECEKSLLDYVRKSPPPPFLLKTYMLVEDPATDEIISWNAEGTAFVVWHPAEFARDLLPTLFKHSNFSSFVRQLNTYGFRKVATSRWEFSNDMFAKGKKNLLCEIRRRKARTNKPENKAQKNQEANNKAPAEQRDQSDEDHSQRSSSTSSSSEFMALLDENKRLRRENGALSSELLSMRKKCKYLLDLVTIYTNENGDQETLKKLGDNDDEVDERPKLFGVRLEVHQGGGGGGGEIWRKRKFASHEHVAHQSTASTSVFLFHSCK